MRECAAHIIILAAACRDELLKFRNDPVPAPVTGIIDAVAVMHLAPSVKAQHNVAHLAVGEIYHIVVDEHSVCSQRKAEIFARFLFNAARICDKALYHVKIHERLAAEEIDLKIAPRARVRDKKIKRLLADLIAHYGAVAVIFALTCKAI